MKRYMQFLLFTIIINSVYGQTFLQENTSIDNFFYPSIDWADYDNDGDKDLVISGGVDTSGDYSADISSIKIYNNNNGTLTSINTPNIYGLHLGFVKFLDIDNDSDLDLITSGQNYTDITSYYFTIYENVNGNFTVKQQLDGTIYSSLDYGDYDNDGDLDLLVTGAYQANSGASKMSRIYNNESGTFTDANIVLPAVQNGNAQFGDFDTDGDLDILIMGTDENDLYILKTFINNNTVFTEGQNLPGMYLGWFTLGDYDNDGDIDFAVMGDDTNDDYAAKIYTNVSGSFSELVTLNGIDNSSGTNPVAWGDYDNDGDLDLVISGTDEDYNDITHLYKNNNNTFSIVNEGLINLGGSASLFWADYDNDKDLDLLISGFFDDANYASQTILHKNNTTIENEKPNAPTNLVSTINTNDSITFSWDNATDDYTPSNGLHYLLTVGTTENGAEIASYKVYGTSWTINNLTANNYYWSVRAIDTAFVMSDATSNQTLGIDEFETPITFNVYPNPSSIDKIIHIDYNIAVLSSNTVEVVIYSAIGQKVYQKTYKEHSNTYKEIDLSALTSGIYLLQFNSGNQTMTKKVILK
ncbi:FG-GAP-like repeat-containing protein [Pontimicrobium sp. MEBiC01747]